MAERRFSLPASLQSSDFNRGDGSRSSEEKNVSRYLKESSGSCHDYCKYGKHRDLERKEKQPLPARIRKTPSDIQRSIEISSAGKKAPTLKTKQESNGTIIAVDASESIKRAIKKPPAASPDEQRGAKSAPSKKTLPRASPDVKIRTSQGVSQTGKLTSTEKKEKSRTCANEDNKMKMARSPSVNVKKNFSSPKGSASKNGQVRSASSSSPSTWIKRGSRPSLPSKLSLNRASNLKAKKKESSTVLSPIKGNINTSSLSESESLPKEEGEPVHEKTLYVIKMATGDDIPAEVSVGSLSSSTYDDQDDGYEEYSSEAEDLSDEHDRREKKRDIIRGGDIGEEPVKLYFRRGKVVEITPESKVPRRLQFRRRRTAETGDEARRDAKLNFQGRPAASGDGDGAAESEKVVLRHQDVQGKKDAQGLFNNVIEETASKLVESRKSKVKALVGAFETVISLQDGKSSNAA